MSTIKNNLITQEGYTPYCGTSDRCTCPRTQFDGKQFVCPMCGWRSSFPVKFIKEYKTKWKKE